MGYPTYLSAASLEAYQGVLWVGLLRGDTSRGYYLSFSFSYRHIFLWNLISNVTDILEIESGVLSHDIYLGWYFCSWILTLTLIAVIV
jgi:hypothetical protein